MSSDIVSIVTSKITDQTRFVIDDNTFVFAFGDVHGCYQEFEQMCKDMIAYAERHGKKAQLWSLGDLIDRGPGFYEVFDVAKRYNVRSILGNHELNFKLEHYGAKKCRSAERRKSHTLFSELTQSQQEEVMDYINSSLNHARFEIGDNVFLMSHAPIISPENFRTHWTYCSRNTPYDPSEHEHTVLHGHQHWNYTEIHKEDLFFGNSFNLDAGVVYGNALVGMCLNTLELFSVKAAREYYSH